MDSVVLKYGDNAFRQFIEKSRSALRLLPVVMGLSGCSDVSAQYDKVASWFAPEQERKEVCDGKPYWCVIATNEIRRDIGIYLDGQKIATAESEGKAVIPVAAGETHAINYCKYVRVNKELFGLIGSTRAVCSRPETVAFDKNKIILIYDESGTGY